MKENKIAWETLMSLEESLAANHLELPLWGDVRPLAAPLQLGDRELPNRLLSQPVEGFDATPVGGPGPRTFERYAGLARGGSGVIWMESISVSGPGRSNPAQLWLNEQNLEEFAELAQLIHTCGPHRPYLVAQLTHSGRFSAPGGVPTPLCAQHSPFIPKEKELIATDQQLEEMAADYLRTAILARKAGFDAVDIRCCHGYLLNELLGAHKRPGRYGGSLQNRARLLLEIVDSVRYQSGIEVGVRLNLFDAVPYPCGFGVTLDEPPQPALEEPLWLVGELASRGVRLLNISAGVGAYSPQVIRPSDGGGAIYRTELPLAGVCRMAALARAVKEAAPQAVVVGSAFSWLRQLAPQAAAGCIQAGWMDLAGFGRLPIRYPDYANDILAGRGLSPERCCVTCNGCMAWIKSTGKPLRCVQAERTDTPCKR